ncbi:hypothetical protein DFJ58DRAFT_734528 [Suillus subalutaceus]|uniref:uncharacterized protein n=1 Tax=Suillus subalutaceus TaxID=48586 RepID=UPI001B87F802|nr:uncharacterized protein DFJ58DRAFT_734528 [Suillus subalutaceus]KAG1837175.1 hypothetical protein DFJ58DRAFT_734528 [Suillus subalutaceus]
MSSSQQANDAFNLVAKKIHQLIASSSKLQVGDPAAKPLAHEIAMTLATAFAQHGNATTSVAPKLLSCAAEIRAKSGPNGKLKALPDWNAILDDDLRIRNHPLFPKTVRYKPPTCPPTPPTALPAPPAPLTLGPRAPSPAPVVTIVPKHKLFVPGNGNTNAKENGKRKASTPEPDVNTGKELKKQKTSRRAASKAPWAKSKAHSSKVKSKEFVTDDDDEQVPADKIIFVKRKITALPGTQPVIKEMTKTQHPDSTSKDDALVEETSTVRLFGMQCEGCIKHNIPCKVVLSKKMGEIWKCCRNCDEKKMKCICPTPEEARVLQLAVDLKKSKATTKTRAAKTPWAKTPVVMHSKVPVSSWSTHATSRARLQSVSRALSPVVDKSGDKDAKGDVDSEHATPAVTCIAPVPVSERAADDHRETIASAPNVDNNVNMGVDLQTTVQDLPVPDARQGAPPNLAIQQPRNLDIIQSIHAMRQEFSGMFQHLGDCSEAVKRKITTQVNDLADNWEMRFDAMEKKMKDVKLHTTRNTISIGHMANTMKTFNKSGNIPPSWLPQLPLPADDCLPQHPSASKVGKLFTTAWDESRGPGAGGAGKSSASAVVSSGHHTGLSAGSQLSSLPSGSSSPKDQ